MSRKRLFLVRSELLGQFVNTLTADYMYSRRNRENFSQQVPMQRFLKLKSCSQFFIAFLYLRKIWRILKKKISVIA